jgi:hypothetical protein
LHQLFFYSHPPTLNKRRKKPHFPRRGQKRLNPKKPQRVGGFTGAAIGDVVTGAEDGALVGGLLVNGTFTGAVLLGKDAGTGTFCGVGTIIGTGNEIIIGTGTGTIIGTGIGTIKGSGMTAGTGTGTGKVSGAFTGTLTGRALGD